MIDEGYIKFDIDWTPTEPAACPEIDELNRWREPLVEAGLIGYYEDLDIGYGNLSARLPFGGHFVISGTQTGHIRRTGYEHYSVVTDFDVDANRLVCRGAARASSESLTHAAIYSADATVNAVVHVHEPRLWRALRGILPTTPADAAYGTPDMARALVRLCHDPEFRSRGVAVMAGHDAGLIAVGKTIGEAARRVLALDAGPRPD